MKKYDIFSLILLIFAAHVNLNAQSLGKKLLDNVNRKVQDKIERRVDDATDKAFDKAKEKVTSKPTKGNSGSSGIDGTNTSEQNNDNSENKPTTPVSSTLKTYSKFDFIPGEKVIAIDDFSQDALGDFPAKWNTNGSGDLLTLEDKTVKWLKIGPSTILYPEFINNLPENFTVEFNLASSKPFSYYSTAFHFFFAPLASPAKDYVNWGEFERDKKHGVLISLHPQSAEFSTQLGQKRVVTFDETGKPLINNHAAFGDFYHETKNPVKISIWRQNQRIRVYVNESKIWDIPRAFVVGEKYNFLGFRADNYHVGEDFYLLSNLKVAVGAPDTRHKFIETGNYTTTGIKFDVNSDKIKGESYGTLKDFAAVLTENPDVRVKIVGHTDSDGDDAANLLLSQKRANAVKTALTTEFGIEKSRMETDGKGEGQSASPNTTLEGKANNRRVEFIKL